MRGGSSAIGVRAAAAIKQRQAECRRSPGANLQSANPYVHFLRSRLGLFIPFPRRESRSLAQPSPPSPSLEQTSMMHFPTVTVGALLLSGAAIAQNYDALPKAYTNQVDQT